MIRVSINGLTIEGTTEDDFTYALEQVEHVAKLAKEYGTQAPSVSPRVARAYCAPVAAMEGGESVDYIAAYCERFGTSKFRIARIEETRFAELGDPLAMRQAAAKQRLEANSKEALTDEQAETCDEVATFKGHVDLDGDVPTEF